MPIPIEMPQLGESVVEGTIIRWLKAPGDQIAEYEPLLEVETDKVITEVTARQSGVLSQIVVQAGETARVGAVLAYLDEADGAAQIAEADVVSSSTGNTTIRGETPPGKPNRFSPVVVRLAEEHGLSLAELQSIAGSGRGGRVRKKDLLRYLETKVSSATAEPAEAVSSSAKPAQDSQVESPPVAPGQTIELSPMRTAIAEHMLQSVQTSPHVTSIFEVDMSRVAAYREAHRQAFARRNLNLSYTAFFVQATVEALKRCPQANASLQDGKIALHPHINIGLAVAVEDGLLVPVIKRAEELSLAGLARAIDDVAARARTRKLVPDDVQGGTFTVTNPGMQGALLGTAIIHQPQAAILGVGAIAKRPVVINDAIAIRPMVYLSLTYDHRIMDGFGANQVLAEMKRYLEHYPES